MEKLKEPEYWTWTPGSLYLPNIPSIMKLLHFKSNHFIKGGIDSVEGNIEFIGEIMIAIQVKELKLNHYIDINKTFTCS